MAKINNPKRPIIITDEKHGLPYSKGLMASAVMATGLAPARSYVIAKQIEDKLYEQGVKSLSIEELRTVAVTVIASKAGEGFAEKYLKWQALAQLDKPLIIMIGGTTGVGKSTVATELAHRLAITRIVATDSIRQVMRAFFSEELMPTLHRSSYDAWKALKSPLPRSADKVNVAFSEQTAAVLVGVKAVVDRAILEGVNMILEGVHLAPGFIMTEYKNATVIPMIISIDEEELHKSHFYVREIETDGSRAYIRYRENFENIRKIGENIKNLAQKHKVPIIQSLQLDQTVNEILNIIIDKIIEPQQIEPAR